MRLVVTGGGTGGHVYPALEVARCAREQGIELTYFGSLRGQEGAACALEGIAFEGFASQPLYSLRTPRGWQASVRILRATVGAKRSLSRFRPDVVFSTGGYSAAPVVTAARSLGIPYVVHEQNSVPGRTNRLAAKRAAVVATTFHAAEAQFPGCRVERTGLPVRRELREAARSASGGVLIVGGSQGAGPLNAAAFEAVAARSAAHVPWVHVSGKALYGDLAAAAEGRPVEGYRLHAFLEGPAMGAAYGGARVAACRAGAGTLAELAVFRIPSVLVPFPLAFANHQFHNAKEFAEAGAAVIVPQDQLTPQALLEPIERWLADDDRREAAERALEEWDRPDAAERLLELVRRAGERST